MFYLEKALIVADWLVDSNLGVGTGRDLPGGFVENNGLQLIRGIVVHRLDDGLKSLNDGKGTSANVCLATTTKLARVGKQQVRDPRASHCGDSCSSSRSSGFEASTVACPEGR